MSLTQHDLEYWEMRLHNCYKAYSCGLASYSEYLTILGDIHDLMVDHYYNGAESLDGLIYQIEEQLEHGIH